MQLRVLNVTFKCVIVLLTSKEQTSNFSTSSLAQKGIITLQSNNISRFASNIFSASNLNYSSNRNKTWDLLCFNFSEKWVIDVSAMVLKVNLDVVVVMRINMKFR